MIALSAQMQATVDFAADLIRQSKRAVALTGAGISTPSGIPDFRSEGTGLWAQDEPLEVASLQTFRTAPEKFFAWFRPLAGQIYHAQPNVAHLALAALEKAGKLVSIITQNIDWLHQKAGSQTVIETHGSLHTLTCAQCYRKVDAENYIDEFVATGALPHCSTCGGLLKPDVILFGEQLPQAAWSQAQTAAQRCDLMIVVGSSLEVLPVAGLPMQALERSAHLLIINRTPTYLNVRADLVFDQDISIVMPAIAEKVLNG